MTALSVLDRVARLYVFSLSALVFILLLLFGILSLVVQNSTAEVTIIIKSAVETSTTSSNMLLCLCPLFGSLYNLRNL